MSSDVRKDGMTEADELLDVPEYQVPAYLLPPSPTERFICLWHAVTRTPTRAALGAAATLAVLIAGFALRPAVIVATDAEGPYRADCGLGYYIGGYPKATISEACHHAYAGHAAILFVCLGVLTGTVVALLALVVAAKPEPERGRAGRLLQWARRQWATPASAALLTLNVVMGIVALASTQRVSVPMTDSVGPLVAHCGLRYYVFGTDNPAVQTACRHAYGSHALLFFVAGGLCLLGVVALNRLHRTSGVPSTVAPA
jgi:hypothetical protein